jgi:LysR family transcriptional regulator, low CO2-responsive transcriptional regulator
MHLTLRQLAVFESVARHMNFSRAAEELHLSQPAASMQIKQLEENIGLPVFEQLGKKIFLTEAGQELLHYARTIQQQLEAAQTTLEDLKGLHRGTLHLTMASTANYFAPQLLAAFHQKYPEAKVQLDVTNRSGLIEAVRNNTTDMAIMGRPPEGQDLVGIPFMINPLVIIAPPSHPLARRRMIKLQELAQEPFIVRENDAGTRIATERFFAEHGIRMITGMEMNRSEAIKQAVMAELGLGIVSLHTIEMELALKRLVVLKVEDFPIMRRWHIVYRQGKRFTGVPKAFMEFVQAHAEELTQPPEA